MVTFNNFFNLNLALSYFFPFRKKDKNGEKFTCAINLVIRFHFVISGLRFRVDCFNVSRLHIERR